MASRVDSKEASARERKARGGTQKNTGPSTTPPPPPLGPFPCWSDLKPGQIDYGSIRANEQRTGIRVILTKDMVGKNSEGTDANQSIRPPGFAGGDQNHARGHLLGKQLGGSGDDKRNLVTTVHIGCNTPFMSKFEGEVRKAVESGQNVAYQVVPIYEAGNDIPIGITMQAKGDGKPPFELSVTVPNWAMPDKR